MAHAGSRFALPFQCTIDGLETQAAEAGTGYGNGGSLREPPPPRKRFNTPLFRKPFQTQRSEMKSTASYRLATFTYLCQTNYRMTRNFVKVPVFQGSTLKQNYKHLPSQAEQRSILHFLEEILFSSVSALLEILVVALRQYLKW